MTKYRWILICLSICVPLLIVRQLSSFRLYKILEVPYDNGYEECDKQLNHCIRGLNDLIYKSFHLPAVFFSTLSRLYGIREVLLSEKVDYPLGENLKIIHELSDNFTTNLPDGEGIYTITVDMSREDLLPLLPQVGYSGIVCSLSEKSVNKCVSEGNETVQSLIDKQIDGVVDYASVTLHRHMNISKTDRRISVSYLRVIKQGFVDKRGYVGHGNVFIVNKGCNAEKVGEPKIPRRYAFVEKELFVLSQYHSVGLYHFFTECLPRAAIYLDFLRRNPEIVIHAATLDFAREVFDLLGLRNKLVHGDTKADIIYMPEGSLCVHTNPLLSSLLRWAFSDVYPARNIPRNRIILIKRSKLRWLDNHDDIFRMLKSYEAKYGFKVEVFSDWGLPRLTTTIDLFRSAIMIVGPHGAGLTNMLFSRRKTIIVEVMCSEWFFGYKTQSEVLGHLYIMIDPFGHNCFSATAEMVKEAVVPYFDALKSGRLLL